MPGAGLACAESGAATALRAEGAVVTFPAQRSPGPGWRGVLLRGCPAASRAFAQSRRPSRACATSGLLATGCWCFRSPPRMGRSPASDRARLRAAVRRGVLGGGAGAPLVSPGSRASGHQAASPGRGRGATACGNPARPGPFPGLCRSGAFSFRAALQQWRGNPGLAKVAELVDAPDLGSDAARRGGSSPPFRTMAPAAPGRPSAGAGGPGWPHSTGPAGRAVPTCAASRPGRRWQRPR